MSTPSEIAENLDKSFPSNGIFCWQCETSSYSYNGDILMDLKINDTKKFLTCVKLNISSGSSLTDDEFKSNAFIWVYDSKGEKDAEKRRDLLKDKLKNAFPSHNITICIFKGGYSFAIRGQKAFAVFQNEYGDHDILVVAH